MIQYGIWSAIEDGFVEDGFYGELGRTKAEADLDQYREDDPDARVEAICDEHPDQCLKNCEVCLAEEDDEDDEDED